MKVLIERELEGEVAANLGERVIYYVMFGILSVFVMWLLGPPIIGVFEAESMNSFISIMAIIIMSGSMSDKLAKDKADQQMTFLQTMPINRSQIVHAKFLSMLLLWSITFTWMSIVVSINLWMNGIWTFESWRHVWFFISLVLFARTITLWFYLLRGSPNINFIYYSALAIWTAIVLSLDFIFKLANFSNTQLWGLSLIFSLVLYFICWWVAVRKVNTKGFPQEMGNNRSSDKVIGDE